MNFQILTFFYDNMVSSASYAFLLFILAVFTSHLVTYLKLKIKIWTQCWFCGQKNHVSFSNRNAWTCTFCLQYNGFAKDGSYNKVIEEQHELNDISYCLKPSIIKYEHHRLCDACNENQEVKIKLFADFVPLIPKNFDKEVNEFRKQIDSLYKLCDNCELLVEKVLDKAIDPKLRKPSPTKPTLNSRNGLKKITPEGVLSKITKCYFLSWHIFAFLAIMLILVYLLDLSNHSYIFLQSAQYNIFRKNYSSDHAQVYKQLHFFSVSLLLVVYSLLTYYRKTFHRSIDSICLGLMLVLVTNNFTFNIFALSHDTLIEFHQWLIFATLLLLIITLASNALVLFQPWGSLKRFLLERNILNLRKNATKKKKVYKFSRLDDEKVIREQIKDLSLSDFGANFDEPDDRAESTNPLNVFSLSPSSVDLPANNFFHCEEMFKASNKFSCFQYRHSDSIMFSQNMIDRKLFDQSEFMKRSNLLTNDYINPPSRFDNQCSITNPRILNYFVNYDRPQPCQSSHVSRSYSNLSNWLTTMFRTFELIFFLVIIGLMVVLFSMPITLSYNSDFNSFELNFAVHNMSSFL